MKKIRKRLIILIIYFVCLFCNYSFATNDTAYEENKNLRFIVDDINSEKIKELYNPDETEIPSRFSLRDIIDIPVGNQKDLGLCDTFAIVKSVETNYALKYGKYIDLSERYLDYITSKEFYGNRTLGSGTSSSRILSILETFGGPAEEEIPYRDYSESEYSKIINATPVILVKSTVNFPTLQNLEDSELKDKWIDILKIHIMKYGSIDSPIAAPSGTSYNYKTYAKYYKKRCNRFWRRTCY